VLLLIHWHSAPASIQLTRSWPCPAPPQICKAGMAQAQSRKIWLTRHGESQYNVKGLIGGDSSLSARGEEYARLLPDRLIDRLPLVGVLVLVLLVLALQLPWHSPAGCHLCMAWCWSL
jgi:hypothetical protein